MCVYNDPKHKPTMGMIFFWPRPVARAKTVPHRRSSRNDVGGVPVGKPR